MPFKPSAYQTAILNFVVAGRGDIVVNAVAGSGKTTTLVEAAKLVRGTCAAFAFNRNAVANLKAKFVGTAVEVKTINGYGHSALIRELGPTVTPQADKYTKMARAIADEKVAFPGDLTRNDYAKMLESVLATVMSSLLPHDAPSAELYAVIAEHDVPADYASVVVTEVLRMADFGQRIARQQHVVSFDDQIWLPVIWNLPTRKYDFTMVDEAQDLSKAKFALVQKARSRGGRMMFVGDPHQAIYGFAGADYRSFANIAATLDATELPLSICYRCPKSVIELAKRHVPHLEAAPNAPEGNVAMLTYNDMFRNVREGDLILCRMTAPLVRACLTLIGQRISARVRGKDIGKGLIKTIRDIARRERCSTMQNFPAAMDRYAAKIAEKYAGHDDAEKKLAAVRDQLDAITVVWEQCSGTTLEAMCAEIDELFSDARASVELSTIHKAKGDEELRVFILAPERLPLTWNNQTEDEYTQELNLEYVAYTRAMDTLFFVPLPTQDEEN